MSNLLERSSLVLTPTAYNNGEALCIKPDDASGDFQFSRNSAATRVNAQGLVENVQILSSNLVQNGDFSEEGAEEVSNGSFSQEGSELVVGGNFSNPSDWNLSGQNLSISNGKGISTGSNFGAQFKQTILTINKTYKLVFDIVDYTSGAIGLTANYYGVQQTFNSVGTHTAYFTSLNQTELRLYSENFIGSIDNCSVREVGQDWDLGIGWSIGEDKAVATNSASGQKLRQAGQLTAGKTYKLVYEVTEITLGGFLPIVGAVAGTAVYSIGTYTEYITTTNDDFYIRTLGTTSGSITNISVKEVGQNWTLNNWSVGDSLVSSGATSFLRQVDVFTSTTSIYKTTFKARSVSGASVTLDFYDGANSIKTFTITSSNFEDFELTQQRGGVNSILYFYNNSDAEIEITNISVIEISTDTNLPRINYEGFSYQDALGSELVTGDNSNFDTSLGNWQQFRGVSVWDSLLKAGKWTDNGTTGSPKGFTMSGGVIPTSANTSYILEFKAKSNTTDTINFNRIGEANNDFTATSNPNLTSDFQNYKFIVNTSLANQRLYVGFDATSFNNGESYWIDNVSVKEYLGQEVVPNSGCGSWLFEPQSTNFITQSELFSDAYWTKSGSSITSNAVISPDGTLNSDKLVEDNTNGNHFIFRSQSSFTPSVDYTQSWFVKAGEKYKVRIQDAADGDYFGAYNLTTGALIDEGTNSVGDTTITELSNGWYRLTLVSNQGTGSRYPAIILLPNSYTAGDGIGYQGDGTSGVYIWGAQLEQQSYATSYIPTEGSTVTRNQDLCTNGGSLATINSTEGVLYAEIAALADDLTNRIIGISDGTNGNRVQIYYSTASNSFIGLVYSGGVFSCSLNTTLSNATDFIKVAFKYKENDFALWVNGVEVATDTSGNSPIGLDRLDFRLGIGILPFFGKTKALAVWKEALSDSELQSLTTI